MSRVLVTGAGGYIGTTLVPALLGNGHSVRAIDRFFFGQFLPADHPKLQIVQDDCRKLEIKHFDNVDVVIDLVAISNDPSGELFQKATWEINYLSRVHTAELAKKAGCQRYILPSSCSIYGFQPHDVIVNETSPTNPLTTYAKANEAAEKGVLPLADDRFCVVVLRQATVYGYSPRMRFDLAINGMTYGAWKTGRLPLLRDGTQWRPMVHVKDIADAMNFMIEVPSGKVNGEIFNLGSDKNNYQIGELGRIVANCVPRDAEIEWYGDPDHRSYRVAFDKVEALGFRALRTAEDGVREICEALDAQITDKSLRTMTLDWYKAMTEWHQITKSVEMYGGMIDLK
ncbi:MAG: SDR family oxidoreductase [Bradyrhizobiaceae bacterium]|nr:SDR family oxidoreductase [Bradyrhizobiaceae bacterium]